MAFMRGRIRAAKETPKAFNPATANGVRVSNVYHGKATSALCGHCHKWFKTRHGGGTGECRNWRCRRKEALANAASGTRPVNPDAAIAGWYEHIGSKPIYIENRKQLYRACVANGVQSKALMSGGVMKKPKGA